MEKTKRTRQTISLETKIEILDRISKGANYTALGKEYKLGESTIRAIKKNEISIRKTVISGTKLSTKYSSYSRDTLIEKVEKAVVIWIEDLTKKKIPVSGYMITEKALKFYETIKDSEPSTSRPKDFAASKGWMTGFIKRNNFHNIQIRGEAASADESASAAYPEKFKKIIEDGGYCPDQVFNADETGLFWKKMPSRTYIAKSEKQASGFKACKERLTILLCSNASGNKMLKPLVVNKFLRPRALKGKDLTRLPVHWMANSKAWVTTALFTEWFHKCFVPEVESYMKKKGLEFKVLLIVDNAPGHPHLEHPNIKVEFFPPNTTSIIQPLDQGIISTFKKYYIKGTYQFILNKIETESLTLNEAWKKFTILDCIILVESAISKLRPQTLNACWKTTWPDCVVRSTGEEISTLTNEIIDLAHQMGGDGFDSLNQDDLEELLAEEPLTDIEVVSSVIRNEQNVDSEDSDSEEIVEHFTSKKIGYILSTVNALQNQVLTMDPDTERALKIQRGLTDLFSGYQELHKELINSKSQSLMTNYFSRKETTEAPKNSLISSPSHEINSSDENDTDVEPIPKRCRPLFSGSD